jgi:demethylmenaquinone methyltransferase/2-methoxy-6-polyprenyl-1,4-benzoquinol methylase
MPVLSGTHHDPSILTALVTETKKNADTDFGYERVPWSEKQRLVRGVFDSVAGNYDLMNDLMSAGAHRLWKEFTLSLANLRPGQRALDVAGGTGDLTTGLAKQVGKSGMVILSDINGAMLGEGRDRLLDAGVVGNVCCVLANAEKLPFADSMFDCVTIGIRVAQCHRQESPRSPTCGAS